MIGDGMKNNTTALLKTGHKIARFTKTLYYRAISDGPYTAVRTDATTPRKGPLGKRAQASVETLLLIGGAVVLAMIVGITLKSIFNTQQGEVRTGIEETTEKVGE